MKKYNQEAAEKTLAAYQTSTDYDQLYKLAKQGYNIPCFLWSDLFTNGDTLFFRLVRCFLTGYGRPSNGTTPGSMRPQPKPPQGW